MRQAGGRGRLLGRRLAAQLLQEPLRHVPQLAHHVDHVDRDADRAGLIGDRPGDRLANPPGGVGGELEAAAVLVLVDRPHQAGVALLDQVQEAQAAVAVLLGDRDDQPQVAAGELPLDLLVVLVLAPHHLAALAEAAGGFPASAPSGRAAPGAGSPARRAWPGCRSAAAAGGGSRPSAPAISSICRIIGLHAARPQAQLLDQREHLAAAADEPLAGLGRCSRRGPPVRSAGGNPAGSPPSGASSVLQVVRHPGDDLLLGQPLGQRDLDRAVERQRAAVHLAPACRPSPASPGRSRAPCGGTASA